MARRMDSADYTVGWVCVLETEQIAAILMLDEEHQSLPQAMADHNKYTLGSIAGHNVVIAGLPKPGNNAAATIVTHMRRTFRNIEFSLLVGIGGGVPRKTDNGMIRLGHVVVSMASGEHPGVVQYDQGKAEEGKFIRTGSLAPPPVLLLSAARNLAQTMARSRENVLIDNIKRIDTTIKGLRSFIYPGRTQDHMSNDDTASDEMEVIVHRGTIASGALVVKDAILRDEIADEQGVLCFETEASGLLDDFPCMVVRGISDYCDSKKNNVWHGFASATAAAYARQLIFHLAIRTDTLSNKHIEKRALSYPQSSMVPVRSFVERDSLQLSIREQLRRVPTHDTVDAKKVGVWGLGGTGKSQLCLGFVHCHRKEYEASFWIRAGQRASIDQDFLHIFRLLYGGAHIGEHGPMTTKEVLEVHRWFSGRLGPWLFVFDGADSIDDPTETSFVDLYEYTPQSPHVHVIYTSRSRSILELSTFEGVSVGPLSKREAVDVFIRCGKLENLDEGTKESIEMIVEELGYLVLAIALASVYISQSPRSTSNLPLFLTEYRQRQKRLLERKPHVLVNQYDKSIMTTWEITYSAIKREMPNACELLTLLSFFHYEDIYLQLLTSNPVTEVKDTLCSWAFIMNDGEVDLPELDDSLAMLERYGILLRQPNGVDYYMHRLVHAWGQVRIEKDLHMLQKFWTIAMQLLARASVATRGWDKEVSEKTRLMPHLVHFVQHLIDIQAFPETERPGIYLWSAHFAESAIKAGSYHEAVTIGREALVLAKSLFGSTHRNTLLSMTMIASALSSLNRVTEAAELTKAVIDKLQSTEGADDPLMAVSLRNLGQLERVRGNPHQARLLFRDALNHQSTLGDDHPQTLITRYWLATVYSPEMNEQEALQMMSEIAEKIQNLVDDIDQDTLLVMSHLALSLKDHGQAKEALRLSQRVLEKKERMYGSEHRDLIESRLNVARCHETLGDLTEYIKAHRKAVDNAKAKQFSPHYILLLENNIAYGLREQGNLAEAEALIRTVVSEAREKFGDNHPSRLMVAHNQAALLLKRGNLGEAVDLCRQVLEARRQILGDANLDTISTMHLLAMIEDEMGSDVIPLKRDVLKLRKKILGEDHVDTLYAMHNLASSLSNLVNMSEAEELARQVLARYHAAYGEYHPRTISEMHLLAKISLGQNKLDEAIEWARRELNAQRKTDGKTHHKTISSGVALANLLAAKEEMVELNELMQELLPLLAKSDVAYHGVKRSVESRDDEEHVILQFVGFKVDVQVKITSDDSN